MNKVIYVSDLKPCPFCGSSYVSLFPPEDEIDICWIQCENIACEADGPKKSTEEAIAHWNTRKCGCKKKATAILRDMEEIKGIDFQTLTLVVKRLEKEL